MPNAPTLNPTLDLVADKSSTVTSGGTAQVLAAANLFRHGLTGQNISAGDLWVSETGTAAVDTVGSYKVVPGASFSVHGTGAISIIGATTGQKFTATEF